MLIVVRADRSTMRLWHLQLAERLRLRPGVKVAFRLEATPRRNGGLDALMRLEALLYPGQGEAWRHVQPQALADLASAGHRRADLVVDLAEAPLTSTEPALRVECEGAPIEVGLARALSAGRAPVVCVLGPSGCVAAGRIGVERMAPLGASYDDLADGVATLVCAALDGGAAALPELPEAPAPVRQSGVYGLALRRARARAFGVIYGALFQSPQWRVGWRRGEERTGARALGAGWCDLPDDGRRFYADPFPVVWRGRTFLFVEDFEHSLGRGVISVVEFGRDGPLSAPRPALIEPGHLSYPFVFEADGEMWMLPEMGYARAIFLYRALDFPRVWRRERTLVAEVVASDATLIERNGRWWMFATVRDGGGSFSQALWLWSAPDFRGPWTPHRRNPVLLDIASARPAGRMIERDGVLWRPVQDCRKSYGAALGWARVGALNNDDFSQTVETFLGPGAGWRGDKLHTYNAAGGFEFIDGSGHAPRWPARRRSAAQSFVRLSHGLGEDSPSRPPSLSTLTAFPNKRETRP